MKGRCRVQFNDELLGSEIKPISAIALHGASHTPSILEPDPDDIIPPSPLSLLQAHFNTISSSSSSSSSSLEVNQPFPPLSIHSESQSKLMVAALRLISRKEIVLKTLEDMNQTLKEHRRVEKAGSFPSPAFEEEYNLSVLNLEVTNQLLNPTLDKIKDMSSPFSLPHISSHNGTGQEDEDMAMVDFVLGEIEVCLCVC